MSKKIDLKDIKENDIDKTASFTDIMTKKEKKIHDDIEDMINEKKKSTSNLTKELNEAKKQYNDNFKLNSNNDDVEDNLAKTQILELTRQIKFNFEENKENNIKTKKKGISKLNVIGEINLLCIGYYTYLLAFTDYQNIPAYYLINGAIVIGLVLLFGMSVVTRKKLSKFFMILNILLLLTFIIFNTYTLFF